MKKKYILASGLLLLSLTASIDAKTDSFLFNTPQDLQIVINNRILAKVNGKAISVMDLTKKMDMLFYKQFPEYASSIQARFQFYQANWKHVLSEIIDKELIVADAQESKLQVSAGDVRQEMETLFGPNIIANLDKIGLTFDEAAKMVLSDIKIRRMLYFKVHSKALNQVTPQVIRNYYENYAKENIRDNEWVFHVISIRHRNPTTAAETANLSFQLLSEDKIPLSELNNKLKEIQTPSSRPVVVNVSEEFRTKEKELSEVFKEILITLQDESYSHPLVQKSKSDKTSVFRIFYRKKMVPGGTVPFNEMESKIKEKLLDKAITLETDAYFIKLRQHYDVQEAQLKEVLSSDVQPFILK